MIEAPELADDAIVARIGERFGLDISSVTFMPKGNDSSAWAYRLDGDDSWFLKVFGRTVDRGGLDVPRYLASLGIDHLVPSVTTVDGVGADEGDPFTFVVYPFFEGVAAGELGASGPLRASLGRLLRSIHDAPIPPEVDAAMRRERFDVRDADYVWRALEHAPRRRPCDAIEDRFLEAWKRHAAEIEHSLTRGEALSQIVKQDEREMVICHADYHAWNVLVADNGDFVVVDWDETIIAPPERDLMFVDGNVADLDPAGIEFYEGYGDVDADLNLLAFYRYDWVLQEVADYHRRLFDWALGEATRQEAVEYFAELFGPDDVVQAALDADARTAEGGT